MKNMTKVVVVNILVFFALLLCIEVAYRIVDWKPAGYSKTIFGSEFAPYVMFINQPNWKDAPYSVFNQYGKKFNTGVRSTNNLGYAAQDDFDFAAPPLEKKTNEKVVLFTGGSAAAGAGASSNDHLITAVMERILNSRQQTIHYKVINFGNGGWISSQEFLGLALWGRPYNPDWVITMDGRNDIAVAYYECEGPGIPKHYGQMQSYIHGYMEAGQGTSFYRGWLENQLIKYSKAYSSITKKYYIPNNQTLIAHAGLNLVAKPFKGDQFSRIMQFYVNTLENIVCLFPNAKYIISLQPLAGDYAAVFGLSKEILQTAREIIQNSESGPANYGTATAVFWNQVKDDVPAMLARYSKDKTIIYKNMSELYPPAGAERQKFFLDEVHMPDEGQELAGIYYAYSILASDFPDKAKPFAAEMRAKLDELIAKTPPAAQ